jgi:predicted ATP-grasp superfamily ATP-dependent carboligase
MAQKNQIPSPVTMLFKKDNLDFEEALSSFSFPALLKPCNGSGGLGIEKFENEKAFRDYCKEHIFSEEFILQTFINGYDIDCSILCESGKILAYTIQKGFINGRGNFRRAAGLDFINDCSTYNLVTEVVQKLNWSGIAHIDLRFDLDTQQINLIEINPRYWGSLMGSYCSGVNFPHLQCLSALKGELVKSEAIEMRYIQGRSAIKSMAKSMFPGIKKQPKVETSFKFILKDPLPTFSYFFTNMLKHKSKSI